MCGPGVATEDFKLTELCKKYNLLIGKDIYFLGFIENVPEVMNCGDVYVLHSAGEAFPNTLIQAMACEIPVVSTDVGDAGNILQNDKYLADAGDYVTIADKIIDILEMDEMLMKNQVKEYRTIVEKQYCIDNVVKKYEESFV